jgi:hypothetical protein
MGAGGGLIGQFVNMGFDMFGAQVEKDEAHRAADIERDREFQRANLAIAGAQEKGAYESGKARLMSAQMQAKQKQAYTAAGVDATQGTAAAVQADTAALGEKDAKMLAVNAAREVYGYRVQKTQAAENANERKRLASTKQTMASLGAVTKFATSAGGAIAGQATGGG